MNFAGSSTINLSGARRRARWQVGSSKFVLNLCILIMNKHRVPILECMSYGSDFEISEELWNNLSHKTYDGGCWVVLVRDAVGIVGSYERHKIFEYCMTFTLFSHTLQGHALHWCATLLENYILSLSHLVIELNCAFNHFDYKALNKEILKLRKAPDESVEQAHTCFCSFACRFLEDEIDLEFLDGRFKCILYISKTFPLLKSFKPCRSYFRDGVAQSQVDTVAVTSGYPPSPHKIAPSS